MIALTLQELKSRPCTLEELQATLIAYIEFGNKRDKEIVEAINEKQNKEWRATI